MRKITQIVPVPCTVLGFTVSLIMYALCDDGTVWYHYCWRNSDSTWKQTTDFIPAG